MATANPALQYIPYRDSVEAKHPDEDRTFTELALTMRHISEIVNDRSRNAFRSVHAKSHALLVRRCSRVSKDCQIAGTARD
jgi:hypothetical protein